MKITKAVIPAAGLGTRVLPATKSMPKEMYPIVDKPAIQYIVEEAVNSGITDILIITNRGKNIIEDYFDRSPELEGRLLEDKKEEFYNQVVSVSKLANIFFLRQKETKGLGHAVNCARSFISGEPFAVLYGDDVIIGEDPACGQLIRAYEKYGKAVVGIKEVAKENIHKYSSLKVEHLDGTYYSCTDMVEKPKTEADTPDIFDLLDKTAPGAGGEIQLTDAMRVLAQTVGMIGVDFTGKRYDIGNKLGILEATVELALKHPELKDDFRAYIKNLASEL